MMSTVSKPYPKEFRDDVVRVARNREPGFELSQIAKDFGIHGPSRQPVASVDKHILKLAVSSSGEHPVILHSLLRGGLL